MSAFTVTVRAELRAAGVSALRTAVEPGVVDLFLLEPGELDWQDRALCAETDPEAFFPEKGGSVREAKQVCRGCEVRDTCLQYALENELHHGIWGGTSERERRKMRLVGEAGELAA